MATLHLLADQFEVHAVTVELDGGTLIIDWREDGVWMTGPTAHVFDGRFNTAWLEDVS